MLSLAEVVPYDFVLSNENIASVQARMPNRNGMTIDGMWEIDGKPDTHNKARMENCKDLAEIESALPDFAKSAHGELLKQNREYGAIRGTRTTDEPLDVVDSASKAQLISLAQTLASDVTGWTKNLWVPDSPRSQQSIRTETMRRRTSLEKFAMAALVAGEQCPCRPSRN